MLPASFRQLQAGSLRSQSSGFAALRFGCAALLRHEEALIDERRDDQDNRDADEGADSVELVETAKVVEEKFCEGDDEQRHAGIADPAGLLSHADKKQREGIERPGDRIGHVAREVAAERESEGWAAGEIVRDLDIQEEQSQDRA